MACEVSGRTVLSGVLALGLVAGAVRAETTMQPPEKRAAPKRITQVVLPLWSPGPVGRELGFGIADRAGALLLTSGDYNHVHLKQALSLGRSHGWRLADLAQLDTARSAAELLGAQVGVCGRVQAAKPAGFRLKLVAFDLRTGKTRQQEVALPADRARAVAQGSAKVAALVAALDGVELPAGDGVQPASKSAAAMADYLSCAAVLIVQPMGLRKSHVVDPDRLAGALGKCQRAVELDPGLTAAWAALSLARSLVLKHEQAAAALGRARQTSGYLPLRTLAHYWLATRFRSSAEGAAVLRRAIQQQPGALVFHTYLGEHLNISREYRAALAVWQRYQQLVEQSPYARAQQGYSLARLGEMERSLAVTREACRAEPDNLDLQLELASRLVDAGELDEAEKLLRPMVEHPRVFGEVLLRLGYVYLLQRDHERAAHWLGRALALAQGPNEWRTRGRTRYDLAILAARQGRLDEAEKQLLAAAEEGFMLRDLLRENEDLEALAERPAVAHLFKDPKLTVDPKLHATPFPMDRAGRADPDRKRPPITGFTF